MLIPEGYWQIMLATFQANDENINVRNERRNYLSQQPIVKVIFFLVQQMLVLPYGYNLCLSMIMRAGGSRNISVFCSIDLVSA